MLECLSAELVMEDLYNLFPGFINGLATGNATLNNLVYEYVFAQGDRADNIERLSSSKRGSGFIRKIV